MATTWDNGSTVYTLPNPDKDGVTGPQKQFVGASGRTLSGQMRIDTIAGLKARIPVRWSMATEVERTAFETAWDACAHLSSTLTLENGEAFTVLAFQNGYNITPWYSHDDTPRYRIDTVFDEVG